MLIFFYGLDYRIIILSMLLGIIVWSAAPQALPKRWKGINGILCLLALYLIARMTVLHRTPSDDHVLQFFADPYGDFYREMLLNVLLFFPLGLTLTTLIGPWSVAAALGLSVAVEAWQYVTGSGTAQGSDVLMNTLGCTIGLIPYIIGRRAHKRTRA